MLFGKQALHLFSIGGAQAEHLLPLLGQTKLLLADIVRLFLVEPEEPDQMLRTLLGELLRCGTLFFGGLCGLLCGCLRGSQYAQCGADCE